jgi:hypothetical protein
MHAKIASIAGIALGKAESVEFANKVRSTSKMKLLLLFPAFVVGYASYTLASAQTEEITIEQVMTPQEMRDSGITTLTGVQRQALNSWLKRYTLRLFVSRNRQDRSSAEIPSARTSCSPAIETTISGEIEGWDGDTIFKLDNGQIWQQASYDYTYFYAYRPDVTIYQTSTGCRMKVEDENDTVLVKRIK